MDDFIVIGLIDLAREGKSWIIQACAFDLE